MICLDEIVFENRFIDAEAERKCKEHLEKTGYGRYLLCLVGRGSPYGTA